MINTCSLAKEPKLWMGNDSLFISWHNKQDSHLQKTDAGYCLMWDTKQLHTSRLENCSRPKTKIKYCVALYDARFDNSFPRDSRSKTRQGAPCEPWSLCMMDSKKAACRT